MTSTDAPVVASANSGDNNTSAFAPGSIAVVTGGGTGMGRELVCQLAAKGCHVATCDIHADTLDASVLAALANAPDGVRVTGHHANVAVEADGIRFAAEVAAQHHTPHINYLFNNAAIAGGGSFVVGERAEWDTTFAVTWGGVYFTTRAFMPMLRAAPWGHVVNTSSINGFWATLGSSFAHTAYSTAKFAVKGFTEALIVDFRLNAPHLRASVVMPGHIGTSILINSGRVLGTEPKALSAEQVAAARVQMAALGFDLGPASDEDIRIILQAVGEGFRDQAPTSAADAATQILDGVAAGEWRILVGRDAVALDEHVRTNPVHAYEPGFIDELRARGVFGFDFAG